MVRKNFALIVTGLAVAALLTGLSVPATQASLHGPYKDLSSTVEAGEYTAYQIEMPTSGWLFLGGTYNEVNSERAVLPIVNMLHRAGGGYSATTGFYYDAFHDEFSGVDISISNELTGEENVHTHEKQISGSPIPGLYFGVPAGTYNIVSLSGPADGTAELFVEVPTDATVLDQERGEVLWGHGIEASSLGYMLRAHIANHEVDYHEWYYSGAQVEVEVQNTLYGYMGFSADTEAHWVSPEGEESIRWTIAHGPATWTMSFPEEHFQYRNCVEDTPVCLGNPNAPYRIFPPFGIAADVGLGTG